MAVVGSLEIYRIHSSLVVGMRQRIIKQESGILPAMTEADRRVLVDEWVWVKTATTRDRRF